jgi:4-amino-4-deoxy-L-arabinose transferase-like glycosyltransferase
MAMLRERLPTLVLIAATAIGITVFTPFTWLVLLTDGLLAMAVVAAAAGWGAWPTVWLGFRKRNAGQQFCLATALGLGLLGTLTLILGATGLLNRPVAWTLLAAGGICGLLRLSLTQADAKNERTSAPSGAQRGLRYAAPRAVVLLVLAVPLVVALFGASLPPGMLWQEEANGYDVLEYHLQGPREYYNAGRITFLPHNVYASFPQQMEMLYLLLMHLAGNVYAAAIPAQLLHAACGLLAVVALGCWAPAGWGRWVVVVVAGSTPWLAYLACLAYVENGMLFFAAVAAGLLTDHYRESADADWRTALAAGRCAGLAGGCKYTAVAFVAVGLALAWCLTMRATFKLRMWRTALFGLGTLLAFSPWLVRNAAFTGNPVYPFAYAWFGGKAWSAGQAQQWSAGHRVPPEYDSVSGRLTLAARELFGSLTPSRAVPSPPPHLDHYGFRPSLFGQALFVLALAGIVLGWSRRTAMLALWSGLILAGWMGCTFITGRFAVPLVVPLAMLAGGALERRQGSAGDPRAHKHVRATWWQWPALVVALAGALINDVSLARRLRDHDERWVGRTGVPMCALAGQTSIFVSGHFLNETLPADAYAWLLGDAAVYYIDRRIHYTVAFSRDPWLEFAAASPNPQACVGWLRDRDVSHVVVSWDEIERLRSTYGFSDVVQPEWFDQLECAGLRRLEAESLPPRLGYVQVYEVLPNADR